MSEAKTWWKADKSAWRNELHIRPVKVIKETPAMITIEEDWEGRPHISRCAKRSDWYNYFATHAEAKQFLTDFFTEKIKIVEEHIIKDKATLERVSAEKEPEAKP